MLLAGFEKGVKFFKKSVEAGRASSEKNGRSHLLKIQLKRGKIFL